MTDRWARWLLHDRHGGNAEVREWVLAQVAPIRERVLDGAELGGDETVLDLGCGDGLIGFGALARLSARGVVMFSDVSTSLVERCREIAVDLGELDRCRFLVASADRLDAVGDASVDAVTARSVLIYLDREGKRRALTEARRVLRPGGRLSLFEPINRFSFPESADRLLGFDVEPVHELAAKVKALWEAHETGSPLLDFDERDLFDWAEQAGFERVLLTLEADVSDPDAFADPRLGRAARQLGQPAQSDVRRVDRRGSDARGGAAAGDAPASAGRGRRRRQASRGRIPARELLTIR